jgi:hypothetical protein
MKKKFNNLIEKDLFKIKKDILRIEPKSNIILQGSFAFNEPFFYNKNNKLIFYSDYDIYVLINNFFSYYSFLKNIKIKNINYNLKTLAKLSLYVVWEPLVKFNLKSICGKNLKNNKFIINKFSKKNLLFNHLKNVYIRLIFLKNIENHDELYKNYILIKSFIECLRAFIICKSNNIIPQIIFSINNNLTWVKNNKYYFNKKEIETIQTILKCRLDPNKFELNTKLIDFSQKFIFKILNILKKEDFFDIRSNLNYYIFLLKKEYFPNLFINYNKEIICVLDSYVNQLFFKKENKKNLNKQFRKFYIFKWKKKFPENFETLKEMILFNVFYLK